MSSNAVDLNLVEVLEASSAWYRRQTHSLSQTDLPSVPTQVTISEMLFFMGAVYGKQFLCATNSRSHEFPPAPFVSFAGSQSPGHQDEACSCWRKVGLPSFVIHCALSMKSYIAPYLSVVTSPLHLYQ